MKKIRILIISFFIILILFGFLLLSGIEKRYYYRNTENNFENIVIKEIPEFKIQLTANPIKNKINCFEISLIINNVKEKIAVKFLNVRILNDYKNEVKLSEISATDGFYNWVEEKNGKAENFDKLPNHLKEISKDLKAYFLYNWNFESSGTEKNYLKIELIGNLLVGEKEIVIDRDINLKMESEYIFQSPIRFH